MRARDPDAARDARVSAARGSRRRRARDVARLLRARPAGRRLRGRHRAGRSRACSIDPRFLYRFEARARRARRRRGAIASTTSSSRRACRSSSGAASPTRSCSQAAAAGTLHEPAALERQVRRMLADARADRARRELRGPVAQAARARRRVAARLRASTPTCARPFAARPSSCSSTCCARTRSVLELLDARYTFLDERLARHYGIDGVRGSYFRRVRVAGRQPARRTARSRQHPDGDVGREPHVARRSRRVDRREPAGRRGAAAAAGRRSRSLGRALAGGGEDAAPAHGGAPRESRLRVVPSAHRPVRLRARELRSRRPLARHRRRRADRRDGGAHRRHGCSTGPPALRARAARALRRVRHGADGEAA